MSWPVVVIFRDDKTWGESGSPIWAIKFDKRVLVIAGSGGDFDYWHEFFSHPQGKRELLANGNNPFSNTFENTQDIRKKVYNSEDAELLFNQALSEMSGSTVKEILVNTDG